MLNPSEEIAQVITLIHQGQKERAREILLRLLKSNSRNEEAWFWLVETSVSDEERIQVFKQCLKRLPDSQRAQKGLALLQAKQGQAKAKLSSQPTELTPAYQPPALPAQGVEDTPVRPRQTAVIALEKPLETPKTHTTLQTLLRFSRYAAVRLVSLAVTVVIGVFLTVIIANLGGFLDKVVSANIEEGLSAALRGGWLREVSDLTQRNQIVEETRFAMEESAGLHSPFLLRSLKFLWKGLTLDWGYARVNTYYGSYTVPAIRAIILDYLPRTLMIFGLANILLFFTSILIALGLSRKYGRWQDRLITALAPLAAAPSWVYGLIIAGITVHVLRIYIPKFDRWPPGFKWSYLGFYLKAMLPAVVAIFISKFFQSVYAWRTIFLVNSSEEYVDVAKAKGMPDGLIERRYILRPLLPNIITSFVLIIVALWQEAIILETIFNVAGIGQLFRAAIQAFDVGMIVALVVLFAYILAFTVFILDIFYALVDPRVNVGFLSETLRIVERGQGFFSRLFHRQKKEKLPPHRGFLTPPQPVYTSLSDQPIVIQRHPERRARYKPVRHTNFSYSWNNRLLNSRRTLSRYPGAAIGLVIILILCLISIFTVIAYPYKPILKKWRGDSFVWLENPEYAQPIWVNWFRKDKLPESMILNSTDPVAGRSEKTISPGIREITFAFPFTYRSKYLPQEIILFFQPTYNEKKPLVTLTWSTPDGRELDLGTFSVVNGQADYMFIDDKIKLKLKTENINQALFWNPNGQQQISMQGPYQLTVTAMVFEDGADINARFVLYGRVWGIAGTDGMRRDAKIGLLWGTPIALVFGLLAAIFTTITTLVIASTGVWFGGWVDGLIQRFTELNMIIPMFPVILMVYTLYSKSFWVLLGITVLLSIFGSSIKNYRSLFLQIKELPYFEAARTYGASNWRIIFRYLIPRIGAIIIPQLVILIPSYVFLEAGLAVLGLYDPLTPPTWGQLVMDGIRNGASQGAYYLALEPTVLLLLTGYSFLLLGISLERVFEPRLRER